MDNYKKDFMQFKLMVNELKKKYNFKGLWHVTDFTNLKSIFHDGELSSRKKCLDNGVDFVDGANHNVINKANLLVKSCTRFYYRPNTPTLYDNEGIKPEEYCNEIHIPRPVYLLFSEQLIYDKDTMFSNGNATNSDVNNTVQFFYSMDWKYIFHNTWFTQEERNYIVNKRQAELLSKKSVSLKYLKKIIFRSNADLRQAIRIWGKDNRFCVNEKYFSQKDNLCITDWRYNNYIKDYNMVYLINNLNLIIYLKKPLKDYRLSLMVVDIYGNNKTDLVINKLKGKLTNKYNKNCEWSDAIKINFNFCDNLSNGDIIFIYINGVLCIEEAIMYNK